MTSLTWGLLVATKDRLDELRICVEKALAQTRLPVEVIVVDASADWEGHARIIGDMVAAHSDIRFLYRQADQPSLTVQRNQALAEAAADIVFLIDDDSFMHADCAEEIMRVYEADTERKVAGVQASLAEPEGVVEVKARAKTSSFKNRAVSMVNGSQAWRRFFIHGSEGIFIPYDGVYPDHPVPDAVKDMDVVRARLFHGARMTFRRENALQELFDPLLRYYCPFEDLDASYRISRTGCLLTSHRARLHHYETSSDRMNYYRVTSLERINRAVLLRRHSKDLPAVRDAYFRILRQHMRSDFFKDCMSMRLSLPKLRATLRASRVAGRVFAMPEAELEAWYPEMQARIVKG